MYAFMPLWVVGTDLHASCIACCALQDMVPALLNLTLSVFPVETIFTPPELGLIGGVWPSIDDLVARGKRVMFVSGADYGPAMNTVIFTK